MTYWLLKKKFKNARNATSRTYKDKFQTTLSVASFAEKNDTILPFIGEISTDNKIIADTSFSLIGKSAEKLSNCKF